MVHQIRLWKTIKHKGEQLEIKEVETEAYIKTLPELLVAIRLKYRKERKSRIMNQILFLFFLLF